MIGTFLLLGLTTLIIYAVVVMRYVRYWKRVPEQSGRYMGDLPEVSVIIPFRDEKENLSRLIEDLRKQTYPRTKYHVFLIDDHSTDMGSQEIEALTDDMITLISLAEQENGKKAAIYKGIKASDTEFLLFSDADTRRGPDWIRSMVEALSPKSIGMVTGPVIAQGHSGFRKYYELELAAFMVVTAGAIHGGLHGMANGANMIMRRSMLPDGDPFRADLSPSGDDIFIAEQFFAKDQLAFVKDRRAIVEARPPLRFDDFLQQKVRWASKTQKMSGGSTRLALGSLALLPTLILLSPLLALMYGAAILWTGGFLLIIKTLIDHLLITAGLRFTDRSAALAETFRQEFMNLRITLSVITHFFSGGTYRWKGRNL